MHVEDHPLEYGDVRGHHPEGRVWRRHRHRLGPRPLEADRRSAQGLAKGHLEFELDGEKLHGRWHLVRIAGKPREKRENWLLIKGDDEAARPAGGADILEERPESVKTGRAVEDVAGEAPGWSSKDRQDRAAPAAAAQPSRPTDPRS